MNRDKQIEEMARVLSTVPPAEVYGGRSYGRKVFMLTHLAEHLYINGYRKASEVALEVIDDIEKIIDKFYNKHIFDSDLEDTEQEAVMDFSGDISYDIAELKKKYTEEMK